MRILMMHKNDANTESGNPPNAEIITKMGAFIGEHMKAGRFVDGAGLRGSALRTRVVFKGGRSTVKHGPYKGEHELPAAILQLEVDTREQAIGWAERYGKILGDGEIELGLVTEPWDLGVVPRPENPKLHFLLIEKADSAAESAGRTPQQKAELTRLKSEMQAAGVLQKSLRLQPSAKGRRLFFKNNELTTFDGPFTESKELLGGFCVMDLPSVDDIVAICRPYAAILGGTLEIDVRPVEAE